MAILTASGGGGRVVDPVPALELIPETLDETQEKKPANDDASIVSRATTRFVSFLRMSSLARGPAPHATMTEN